MIRLREIAEIFSSGFVRTCAVRNIDLDVRKDEFLWKKNVERT